MIDQFKLSTLQSGPVRHPDLPEEFVNRVRKFKAILGDVDLVTLDETLDGFKRDAHPEQELMIWERIANTFHSFMSHRPAATTAVRTDVYAVLLFASTGNEDWRSIQHLTPEEINHLVANYRGLP